MRTMLYFNNLLYSGGLSDIMPLAANKRQHTIQKSGGVPERPKGADCKSAVTDFEGSNPSPTTIKDSYFITKK